MGLLFISSKVFQKIHFKFFEIVSQAFVYCLFKINDVKFKSFITSGVPSLRLARKSRLEIGYNFRMNNSRIGNYIGFRKCVFAIDTNATINIGNNVGMSSAMLVAHTSIEIQDFVNIGADVRILDSDFHSLNFQERRNSLTDQKNKKTSPVIIENDVFIGTGSIILKGVRIGARSIIAAGSVVSKNIPADEIWGGNPACFIKSCKA